MLTRRLDEDDEEILPQRRTAEREMTLGTGAILGVFFGIVLSWGAFFGFGYKLGSSATKTAGASADTPEPASASTSANFNAFKPAAGSPLAAGGVAAPAIPVRDGSPVLTVPVPLPQQPSRANGNVALPPPPAVSEPSNTLPTPATVHAAPAPSANSPASNPGPIVTPGGSFVVQVAAVSHQEDADLLIGALRAKGYAVAARSESGDRLVHIQVGPFGNRKDADTMKARLSADGYNAYIK